MAVMNRRGFGMELVFLLSLFIAITISLYLSYYVWTNFTVLFTELGVGATINTAGTNIIIHLETVLVFFFFGLGLLSLVLASQINASPMYYVAGVFLMILGLFFVPVGQRTVALIENISGLNESIDHFPLITSVWDNMGLILLFFGVGGIALTFGTGGGLSRVGGA